MAVHHMVWIKFNDGVDAARVQQHLDNLASLRSRVPGVVSLHVGENFTDRAQGFTHGLIVTFADRAGLDAYLPHDEHMKVAGPLKQDAALLAMDIED